MSYFIYEELEGKALIAKLDMSMPTLEEIKQIGKNRANVKTVQTIAPVVEKGRLKVAAYCRVSTLLGGQDSSIEIQREHFEAEIDAHPDWENAGIYYERVSGTHKENRPELNRLMDKCRAGQVDLVLTKSISRFARNTTDLLWMVRELNSLGTHVIFDKESIDTRTSEGELMLTLLGSFAEDEVRSISENNRWAIQKRFEDGTYRFASAPFGYDIEDGKLIVNQEEAEIVRWVFEEYLAGKGSNSIAKVLNERGIRTKRASQNWVKGKISGKWVCESIVSMIQNEAYIGDVTLQKSYIDENFQVRKNEGKYKQFHYKNHHEAIIDRETFEKAQGLRMLRRKGRMSEPRFKDYVFTKRIVCGNCGSVFWRAQISQTIEKRVFWECAAKSKKASSCRMGNILEESLKNAFLTVLNKLHFARLLIQIYIYDLSKEFNDDEDRLNEIMELKAKLNKLDALRAEARIEMVDYYQRKNEVEGELIKLERAGETDERIEAAKALLSAVEAWEGRRTWCSEAEALFQTHLEKVIVRDKSTLCFRFKCGLFFIEKIEELSAEQEKLERIVEDEE